MMFRIAALGLLWVAAPTDLYAQVSATSSNETGYRLGSEDQIQVDIYGPTTTSVKTRIKADGTITLPLVGTVQAAGQAVETLGSVIASKLKAGRFLNDPIVNVEVLAYASQTVTVLGEVGTPGIFPLDRPQTLSEMISRVGGLKSAPSDRVLLRHQGNSRAESYSIGDIARGTQRDIPLRSGDVIYVSPADMFYVYGQVGSAGAYAIAPGMTVRQAVARAGGLTLAGSEKKITLFRGGREADADLNEPLRSDDVLFVRERTF